MFAPILLVFDECSTRTLDGSLLIDLCLQEEGAMDLRLVRRLKAKAHIAVHCGCVHNPRERKKGISTVQRDPAASSTKIFERKTSRPC